MFMGDHVGAAFFQTSLSLLFGKALRSGLQFGKHLGGHDGSGLDELGRHLDVAIPSPRYEKVSRKNRTRMFDTFFDSCPQHHHGSLPYNGGDFDPQSPIDGVKIGRRLARQLWSSRPISECSPSKRGEDRSKNGRAHGSPPGSPQHQATAVNLREFTVRSDHPASCSGAPGCRGEDVFVRPPLRRGWRWRDYYLVDPSFCTPPHCWRGLSLFRRHQRIYYSHCSFTPCPLIPRRIPFVRALSDRRVGSRPARCDTDSSRGTTYSPNCTAAAVRGRSSAPPCRGQLCCQLR